MPKCGENAPLLPVGFLGCHLSVDVLLAWEMTAKTCGLLYGSRHLSSGHTEGRGLKQKGDFKCGIYLVLKISFFFTPFPSLFPRDNYGFCRRCQFVNLETPAPWYDSGKTQQTANLSVSLVRRRNKVNSRSRLNKFIDQVDCTSEKYQLLPLRSPIPKCCLTFWRFH
jgi:hypothetical protein